MAIFLLKRGSVIVKIMLFSIPSEIFKRFVMGTKLIACILKMANITVVNRRFKR
jgi:hypothetical protein